MANHPVVSHEQWLEARKQLLAKEKEYTRAGDALAQARRDLPWERVENEYLFDGPRGKESLKQLFAGRSQLAVYHFMFGPDWEAGCPHCSFWADNFNSIDVHLAHRDVTFIVISHAPLAKLDAFKKRMGWSFKWVSAGENGFNYDYNVSFKPDEKRRFHNYQWEEGALSEHAGMSAFFRDANGAVFHTYSAYSRGLDALNGAYHWLDRMPNGRDEDGLTFTQSWVRHRDRYEDDYQTPGQRG